MRHCQLQVGNMSTPQYCGIVLYAHLKNAGNIPVLSEEKLNIIFFSIFFMLKPTLNVNFYNNHSDNSINFINFNHLFNHFNILGAFYCMKIIYCLSHVNIVNNIVILFIFF